MECAMQENPQINRKMVRVLFGIPIQVRLLILSTHSFLVYGSVWKKELFHVSIHDEDINQAYIFYLKYLDAKGDLECMKRKGVLVFRILKIRKKIIHYTENNQGPLYVQIKVPSGVNKTLTTITVPVTFGKLISFHIEWKTMTFVQFHRVVISESRPFQFHLYSHTYDRHFYNALYQPSTCSQFIQKHFQTPPAVNTEHTDTNSHPVQDEESSSIKTKIELEIYRDKVNSVSPVLYQSPDLKKPDELQNVNNEDTADTMRSVKTIDSKSHEEVTIDNKISKVTIRMRRTDTKPSTSDDKVEKPKPVSSKDSWNPEKVESEIGRDSVHKKTDDKINEEIENTKSQPLDMEHAIDPQEKSKDYKPPIFETVIQKSEMQTYCDENSLFENDDSCSNIDGEKTKTPAIFQFVDSNGQELVAIDYNDQIIIRKKSDMCMREIKETTPLEVIIPNTQDSCPNLTWSSKLQSYWMCFIKDKPGFGCCTLSIMTYNIWFFNPLTDNSTEYVERIKRVEKILSENNVDIIGLQEVRYEEGKGGELGPNQIEYISSVLPQYQFVYQPAMLMPTSLTNGKVEEGLAILTKYEILHHDYILLFRNASNSADRHQRICLHVEINIPGVGSVHVFNTHLSLSHEARERSVKQIWSYINTFTGPKILLGDFNAEPQEKSIRYLVAKSNMVDMWPYIHGKNSPGKTFNARKRERNKRIDYIFHLQEINTEILDIQLFEEKDFGSTAASDHLPLLSTIGFNCPQNI
ncbi:hypothetical protein LOTGIDRAFT_232223 [Lottia gigantea]|uniref:Endonuclease/exonuclease/phosphatase domain-containing protein n=1 Tax=Lottia gigantea TaxID=225164 RepID=V4C106_LOTGI|nr:hypothetical protein LOTGIDRAFT_232223 [Lottia gigantea]ESO95144.1 hypothetical protein LOTGIDRAFT_232223 [Lottia gigantea]